MRNIRPRVIIWSDSITLEICSVFKIEDRMEIRGLIKEFKIIYMKHENWRYITCVSFDFDFW